MTSLNDPLVSARDVGRAYSGPALAAYLQWVRSEVECYSIDFVLFIDPSCGWVRPVSQAFPAANELWIHGSEGRLRLAELSHSMIEEGLVSLAVGFHGLNAREVFAKFGMATPADHVLSDLGLTDDRRFGFGQEELTHRFIRAFKWEFFRVANRTRSELFSLLARAGLRPGMQVALVGMGWTVDLVDSCERVMRSMLDVNVQGFGFLLTEAEEKRARDSRFFFKSFLAQGNLPAPVATRLAGRLDLLADTLLPPTAHAGKTEVRADVSAALAEGIADHAATLAGQGRLAGSVRPLLNLVGAEDDAPARQLLGLPAQAHA
ncbi:hypothetical protein [Aquabacter cavernae]|uniref:hypothetical protein n=1 Tax=Aquabacter cavernae TaxID=2496029 RepID=UPI000F8D3E0E|nr:hypothetical protein [Aquabacter cavernae]